MIYYKSMVIRIEQPEFDLGLKPEDDNKKTTEEKIPDTTRAGIPLSIQPKDSHLAPQPNPEAWDREEDPGDVRVMYRRGNKHR